MREGDKIALDAVRRFEQFNAEVKKLARQFELPLCLIPHLNRSNHESYENYFDVEMIGTVHEVYKKDIDGFGFQPPAPASASLEPSIR
jgi:hypothetical protein